jgi:hypothetical protein
MEFRTWTNFYAQLNSTGYLLLAGPACRREEKAEHGAQAAGAMVAGEGWQLAGGANPLESMRWPPAHPVVGFPGRGAAGFGPAMSGGGGSCSRPARRLGWWWLAANGGTLVCSDPPVSFSRIWWFGLWGRVVEKTAVAARRREQAGGSRARRRGGRRKAGGRRTGRR